MNPPPRLYKYQSCTDKALENLGNRNLWFSKPENFNDPFDCNINFTITDVSEENSTALLNDMGVPEIRKREIDQDDVVLMALNATEVVKRKQWTQLGVACFSEHYDNILMWSHYTEGHQGYCLEFDTNFSPFKPEKTKTLLKVDYPELNSYPSLSLNDIPNNLPNLVETQLGTKSVQWSYEKEWRIFADYGDRVYSYPKEALIGVYFGCKMIGENKEAIMKLLANSSPRWYQMKKSKTEFNVIAKEINVA